MVDWLGGGWSEGVSKTVATLPEVPGLTGAVTLAVSSGPKSELRVSWRYVDGVASPAGVATEGTATEGTATEREGAALELTIGAEDAADLLAGRVEPSVSFMRGRLKASGDGALLIGFLRSTADPAFDRWRRQAAAVASPPPA